MAEYKLTELTALLAANAVDTDIVAIVDVSGDITHKMVVSELRTLITNALIIGTNVQAWDAILDATTASYTTALNSKLGGIEASADVTDEANVVSSLDGATLIAVTGATGDKIIIQDLSDSDNIKTITVQSILDLAVAGSATEIQVNVAGALGSYSTFVFDGITQTITSTTTGFNPVLNITNNQAATDIGILNLTAPNLATNDALHILMGKSASSKNRGNISWYHSTDGADLNGFKFEMYGVANVLVLNASGNVIVGASNASARLHVVNSVTTTIPFKVVLANGQTEPSAREVNTFGGSGGDVELLTKDGNYYHAGSYTSTVTQKTATYTILDTDATIECTANTFTVTLPTAVGISGRKYNICNTGTGVITLAGDGSETIFGSNTQSINQWENIPVQSNGTNWLVL